MTDHVYKKFPNLFEAIQAVIQKDSVFRDICADYNEISTWLACCDRTKGITPQEYDRALEIKRDLEDDIQRKLQEEGF